MTTYFIQAFIYLCAAVISVPIAKRLGLGSVLGYLIAGVIIGPVVGLVGKETQTIQHFAEFGVVMMLFLVGLELEPKLLWRMRHRLLGLGGLQLLLTVGTVMGIALLCGQVWQTALTIGLIFSLSSTAIVLQTFSEKGLSKTEGGRNAFSVLLFQDIAVIPMLALIPLLALPDLVSKAQLLAEKVADHHQEFSFVANISGWLYGLVIVAAIASVVIGGHYLSRPLFRFVASSGVREIFTAAALMLVIGIAALMSLVGLSPALGTFLAGVVLANSEFRHELEANIEPFKGLLLGLFFITVGASINFHVLLHHMWLILGIALGLMLIKAIVLFVLGMVFRVKNSNRWLLALSLAQAGEFGFVLLSFTAQNYVLPKSMVEVLSLVVALSMFLTPGLFIFFDKVILPRFESATNERESDLIDEPGTVVIAGIGRFGQIVNRLLVANGIKTVVLDYEAGQIDNMRSIGIKSYFGDATRFDLLHTAGIDDAKMMIVAIDNQDTSVELVEKLRHHYPKLPIFARAYDRGHHYALRCAGSTFVISETYHSALTMGTEALKTLGFHPFHAEQLKSAFMETEAKSKDLLYETWKESTEDNKFNASYRELFIQLETALSEEMQKERSDRHTKKARGWTPPPKGYEEEVAQVEQERDDLA